MKRPPGSHLSSPAITCSGIHKIAHIRYSRQESNERWRELRPNKVLGILGCLWQAKGWNTGTTLAHLPCNWSGARVQDTRRKYLQPLGSWTLNCEGIHRDEPVTQLYPEVIIIGSSTDVVCETTWLQAAAMCGLPGAQFGDSQEPIPPTPHRGLSWSNGRSLNIDLTAPREHLLPDPNQRCQGKYHCLQDALQPGRILGHSWLIHQRVSCLPGLQALLPTTLHFWLQSILPRVHTDRLDQRERGQGSPTNGTSTTTPIHRVLQSQQVPVRSLGDWLLRIYLQVWQNRHAITPHISQRRLAFTHVHPRSWSASGLHQLLPNFHLQIRQSTSTSFRLTKEINKQMSMAPKGRTRIHDVPEGIW